MSKSIAKFYRQRLRDPEVRRRISRVLSMASMLIAIGACVVLVLAFMMQLYVLVVAFSGVLSVTLAFYLFVRLWPKAKAREREEKRPAAAAKPRPKPKLSPEEYRRQRLKAQQMIRDKAAPALAKAIRGYLQQDEMQQKEAWRHKRRKQ